MDDDKHSRLTIATVFIALALFHCVEKLAGFQAESDRYRACVAYHPPEQCGPLPGVSP